MKLSDQDIEAIAQRIAAGIAGAPATAPAAKSAPAAPSGLGVFSTINEAVAAAGKAFPVYVALSLETRKRIIGAIRQTMLENATALARAAYEETGLGRFEDKILKNQLVAEKTPGTEDLLPLSFTGDHGLTLCEPAPYGVIGAITPCTNPTSTIINNAISMLAAGNTVVFNAHPAAKGCSAQVVALLNKAVVAYGGPPNAAACVAGPTVESAQEMMKHPGVRLIVVTGGGGVVKAAMASGKRAICAGPGNPPVVVDETADIEQAARDIVLGASFDNNIICVEEKEVIVVASVADALIKAMQKHDAVLVEKSRLPQLEQTVFARMAGPREHAEINRGFIGKNADLILNKMGLSVPSTVRLGIVEVDETHPLLWTEQMMPIMPVCRVPNADYAIDLAIQVEGCNRHTMVMHSKNLDHLSRMAKECNCSIFVKNGRSQAGLGMGGEGYTSFTIASPTGEGLTSARSFSRWRRCVLVDHFRIV
ncbi:MAG: aldehyde dehydrogenase family protein [Verrucomicrobiota bacterium]